MITKRLSIFPRFTLAIFIAAQFCTSAPANEDGVSQVMTEISLIKVEIERFNKVITDDPKDQLSKFGKLLRYEQEIGDKLNLGIKRLSSDHSKESAVHLATFVDGQFGRLTKNIELVQKQLEGTRTLRAAAAPEDLIEFEYELAGYDSLLSKLLQELLDNTERAELMQLESIASTSLLEETLQARAEDQTDRLDITQDRINAAEIRLKRAAESDRGQLEKELVALEERQQRIGNSLDSTIDMLRKRNIDARKYTQVLIRSSGQISDNLLDTGILFGLFDDWAQVTRDSLARNGPGWLFKATIFVLILMVSKLLSKFTASLVSRAVRSSPMNFSTLLQQFFTKVAANVVLIVGFLIALGQIGIHLGPVLAGLGVAGLIVGFALQDTLSNFASGLMILIYRPYDVGDSIEAGGVSGKVQRMNLVSTTVMTFDNQKLIVPNNNMWGGVIRNVNAAPTRRVDLVFGISYDDDIGEAEELLKNIVDNHELVLKDPEPAIKLHKLGESSVDFIVRPWVNAPDYWTVYWDVTRAVKDGFTQAGITIPYPQRDIHLYEQKRDG